MSGYYSSQHSQSVSAFIRGLALTQVSQQLISGLLLKIKRHYLLLWSTMTSNHCSICVISLQMNQDIGCVEGKWWQFRFQKEMPCQIDLPAVTYQYLTFLQSLRMVPAHHFAHGAGLINSSHFWDLSPTPCKKEELMKTYEGTQWMSRVHLAAYHVELTGSLARLQVHAKVQKSEQFRGKRKMQGCRESDICWTNDELHAWNVLRIETQGTLKCRKTSAVWQGMT